VTWTQLLANRDVQRHRASKNELDAMRALIARDLADAAISALSADRRFATAYNAALQAANMAIGCAGYASQAKQAITKSRSRASGSPWAPPPASTPITSRRAGASAT
jgi:hypothetical protein